MTDHRSGWRALRLTAPVFASLLALAACSTLPPAGVVVVAPFDIARYEGRWYEIARLDHSFERGLTDVSATYRRQADGSVEVVNRGYDGERNAWRRAVGRAVFNGDPSVASLRVSFFGPFYGGYHVVALDPEHYRWAMVIGPSREYLWILSRDRRLPDPVRDRMLAQAGSLGIDVRNLIWVDQSRGDD